MTTLSPVIRPEMQPELLAEPLWFFRMNPLTRVRLSDPALNLLLGELKTAERAVDAAARQCSNDIHAEIGRTTDPPRRGKLVALRRAIHNDRTVDTQAADELPAVSQWALARAHRSTLQDRLGQLYPAAAEAERRTLASLLADEDLRCSLALVAPEVLLSADRYRAAVTGDAAVPARARKSERGLIQYVTRAMIRTSPLSRFTAVGLAIPDQDGLAPDQLPANTAVPFLSLDRVMLDYVLAGLAPLPSATDSQTWVRLPPTSAIDLVNNRLYILQPAGPNLRRLSTPITTVVSLLLDAVSMGPRRLAAVALDLVARSGCSEAAARQAITSSLQAGILCTADGPEDGSADDQQLLDRPTTAGASSLARIRADLPKLATTTAAQRPIELDSLNVVLRQLSQLAQRPAQIIVEEDSVLPPMKVATASWRPVLDDLGGAVELLAVFDRLHDVRALLSAVFVERFGSGANVLLVAHASEIIDEVYRRAEVVEKLRRAGTAIDDSALRGIGPADGSLERLHQLRLRTLAMISDRITEAHQNSEDVSWSAAEARALAGSLPERFRQDPIAYGVLSQPWQDRLIVNDILPGHGMLYGRFLKADRALGGNALSYAAGRLEGQYGGDGSRVVEDLGLYGLNVNAHPQVLDGVRADDWFTLRLVHDPHLDSLTIQDVDGQALRVLTLGSGHPGLFPPPLRLASCLITGGRLFEDLIGDWHRQSEWDDRQTRSCPRVSIGRTVIFRRRWYGGQELESALATGPEESDRLLALTRWRSRHGIPEEVVLKTTIDNDGPLGLPEAGSETKAQLRLQKPQYVDLASALSTRVLPRMMQRRGVGYVEEALPAVGESTHAYEWVVQIDRAAGGQLRYTGGAV